MYLLCFYSTGRGFERSALFIALTAVINLGMQETDLKWAYYDETVKSWVVLSDSVVDMQAKSVNYQTTHFSDWVSLLAFSYLRISLISYLSSQSWLRRAGLSKWGLE